MTEGKRIDNDDTDPMTSAQGLSRTYSGGECYRARSQSL
jgi:hypothetical protein